MQTSEAFLGLRCTATGDSYAPDATGLSDAGAPLDPAYDYDSLSLDPETFADGAGGAGGATGTPTAGTSGMWRFDALLPFPADTAVTAAEGGTPLVEAPSLAEDLGAGRVVVKDEARNPTGTVLDRGLSLAVTAARERDATDVALASPGNAAQSAASYASRAGMESHAFVPSRTPFSNKAMVNVHAGDMRVGGGRFDDARAAFDDARADEDWHSLQEFDTPYRHEGIKTVAFEIAADLGWSVPDAVVVPVGTGEVCYGVAKGFRELREVGLTDALPTLYAAQPSGCAPVVAAFERGDDVVEAWRTPDTICGELEIPDPAGGGLALDALAETDGDVAAVDDPDTLESAVVVTQCAGIEMGVAGGVAAAGAWELASVADAEDSSDDAPDSLDAFGADDTVVLLNADAGVKTPDVLRSHLMGQGI